MTNKEAIKGLKALSKEFSGYKPNEEMFDMAIKALELVTINSDSNEIKVTNCNYKDTIYRQAAIDAVKKNTFRLTFAEEQNCEGHVAWSAEAVYSDVMEGALLDLPSAQPERMRGKWIDDGDPFMWKCGCCGYRVKRYNNTRYCPNCGAEMREVSE